MEATEQYVTEQTVDFPLWVPTSRDVVDFQVAIVPYTVLVNPGGAIGSVWTGVLDDSEIAAVTNVLDGELFAAQQMLSGSSARDPDNGPDSAPDTDAATGQ